MWTVLDAVAELDLSAIYADYREDGRPSGLRAADDGRPVAYAYARGNRSSRGIERACVEDVAYRVVAGNLVPDHSTIAEFRCRHEGRWVRCSPACSGCALARDWCRLGS